MWQQKVTKYLDYLGGKCRHNVEGLDNVYVFDVEGEHIHLFKVQERRMTIIQADPIKYIRFKKESKSARLQRLYNAVKLAERTYGVVFISERVYEEL